MEVYFYICAALFGACIFSFLNVLIYRIPNHMNFVHGRSICPQCSHTLSGLDMIPVFSWIFLRGKCRYCKTKIPVRYTIVELTGAVLGALCYGFYKAWIPAVLVFIFFAILTVIAWIDAATMEIPDGLNLALLVPGILAIFLMPDTGWIQRVIGLFVVSVPLFVIAVIIPGAFGGGDIKMMAAAGLFLGWKCCLLALFFGVLLGGAYGIYVLLKKKLGRKDHFAFGPFLCAGIFIALFWGNDLLSWYLSLFFN